MRALVTGADGFVGRHLMSHLEAQGDSPIGWDRSTGGPDLLNARDVIQLFDDVRPDAVYHLAGDADVGRVMGPPESTFMANAVGTMHVLAAARQAERGTCALRQQRGRLRPGHRGRPAAHRGRSPGPGVALRGQQGRRRRIGAAGLPRPRPRGDPGPALQPPRAGPAHQLRRSRHRRPDRPQRGRRWQHRGGRQPVARRDFTDVRDVVRAYRLLIGRADPSGPTTCARATTWPSRNWPISSWTWPPRPWHWCRIPTWFARSTCRSCAAATNGSARRPAGNPRSPFERPSRTCSTKPVARCTPIRPTTRSATPHRADPERNANS